MATEQEILSDLEDLTLGLADHLDELEQALIGWVRA